MRVHTAEQTERGNMNTDIWDCGETMLRKKILWAHLQKIAADRRRKRDERINRWIQNVCLTVIGAMLYWGAVLIVDKIGS